MSFEQLQRIVSDFRQSHQHQVDPEPPEEDDDFEDFQEAEGKEATQEQYADYNWDFLKASPPKITKPPETKEEQVIEKPNSSESVEKPEIKKQNE